MVTPYLSKSGKTLTVVAVPGCRVTAFRGGKDKHWRIGIAHRGRVASIRVNDSQRAMAALLEAIAMAAVVRQ